jgi:3D (Asp-Asp-Asp) domain-containing protein
MKEQDQYTKNTVNFLRKQGYVVVRKLIRNIALGLVVLLGVTIFAYVGLFAHETTLLLNTLESQEQLLQQKDKTFSTYKETTDKELTFLRGESVELTEKEKDELEFTTTSLADNIGLGFEAEFVVSGYSLNDGEFPQGTTETSAMGDNIYEFTWRVCAVDPAVIPLSSIVIIELQNGREIACIARDTGNKDYIGGYRIDLCFSSKEAAKQWGMRKCAVKWFPPKF